MRLVCVFLLTILFMNPVFAESELRDVIASCPVKNIPYDGTSERSINEIGKLSNSECVDINIALICQGDRYREYEGDVENIPQSTGEWVGSHVAEIDQEIQACRSSCENGNTDSCAIFGVSNYFLDVILYFGEIEEILSGKFERYPALQKACRSGRLDACPFAAQLAIDILPVANEAFVKLTCEAESLTDANCTGYRNWLETAKDLDFSKVEDLELAKYGCERRHLYSCSIGLSVARDYEFLFEEGFIEADYSEWAVWFETQLCALGDDSYCG